MLLHRLTISALGPFAGCHTIDFDQLAATGLFLMEGATGSGKTTVIDAISFALYGQVASDQTSQDRLRSDHAVDADTWVELVYSTPAGLYRIWRAPSYERPKKHGTGTTTQNASVKLWRLTSPDDYDGGELISNRVGEASAEIQRTIGLDHDQFTQTIVLPQGEFSSFLRAEGETRRALLQKIFGTGMYERWQRVLEERRKSAGAKVGAARSNALGAVAHFSGALGAATQPLGPDATDEQITAALVQAQVDTRDVVAQERAAGAALDAAQAGYLAATERMAALTARVTKLRRCRELAGRRRELADQREVYERDVLTAGTAQRAAQVRLALGAAARSSAEVWAAQGELVRVRDEMLDSPGGAGLVAGVLAAAATDPEGSSRQVLSTVRDDLMSEYVRLERPQRLEAQLPQRRAALAEAQGVAQRCATQASRLRELLAARPAQREELASRREELVTLASRVPLLSEQVAAKRAVLRTVLEAGKVQEVVARLEEQLAEAIERAATAVDLEAAGRRGHLADLAAELAGTLAAGRPCPVCGSLDHPNPARASNVGLSRKDVDDLAEQRAEAEGVVAGARARLAGEQGKLAALLQSAGTLDVASAQGAAEQAEAELAAARQAASMAQDLVARIAEFDAATELQAEQVELLEFEASSRGADAATMRSQVEQEDAEVRAALYADTGGDGTLYATVADHRTYVEGQLVWAERLAKALDALMSARTQADLRCDELATALAEQGFSDETQARAALLSSAQIEELEERIAGYLAAVKAVDDELAQLEADPEAQGELGPVEMELSRAIGATKDADAVREGAAGVARAASQRAGEVSAALDGVVGAIREWESARSQAAPVLRMADVVAAVTADNTRRISLPTYVLMRRFDDVVAAANDRLLAMSDGRYELQRSEDKEDTRARRIGLALKVRDHLTEESRDPRTLSGGETFYVSLCLALGLADVVGAEAGGIDLGTLFIDEGFGTLDPETLDAVMRELTKLRDSGRVVGVVSHVDALKSQISERIEIRRMDNGVSTLAVVA